MNYLIRTANIDLMATAPINQTYNFDTTTVETPTNNSIPEANPYNIIISKPIIGDVLENRFTIYGFDNINNYPFLLENTIVFQYDFNVNNPFSCVTNNLFTFDVKGNVYIPLEGPMEFNKHYYFFKGNPKGFENSKTSLYRYQIYSFLIRKKNTCLCKANYVLEVNVSNQL